MTASRIIHVLAAAALLVTAFRPAAAQGEYPSRAIRIIVPVAPGGTVDFLARMVADHLGARWGQPVIIENRSGAGGNLGAEAAAKAVPDGYTLLVTGPGPLVTSQVFYPNLGFNPSAFVPISMLATAPFVLAVHPKVPSSTLQELIAYARENPKKLNFASPGRGSRPHLAFEMLKAKANVGLVHIPYKGLVPALNDLLAGHVDMMFHDVASTLPHIKGGKLKALGVGSDARLPELPDVPAISEQFPEFSATTWFAIVAPPRTPIEIVDRLSQAVVDCLQRFDVAKRLYELSIIPGGSSPAATAAFLTEETERWREVIVAAGVKPE